MHSLPKCIKTGKKRPEFFSKYKGALYSLPPFKLLFLHIFVYSQFCLLENSSFHVLGQTKSPLPVNANAIGRINSPIPVTSCIKSVSSYTSILQSTKKDIFLSFFDKNTLSLPPGMPIAGPVPFRFMRLFCRADCRGSLLRDSPAAAAPVRIPLRECGFCRTFTIFGA